MIVMIVAMIAAPAVDSAGSAPYTRSTTTRTEDA